MKKSIFARTHDYDDIISLPHHRSLYFRRMTRSERAAQFSPFSALTGLEDALNRTAIEAAERQMEKPSDEEYAP